jgi:integrase
MHEQGLGITSSDALDYLHDARFRGNIKGTSVRTRDPNQGAFNDAELLSIQAALNNSYAEGRIDLSDFAAAWVLLAYGVRPIQIAALKECDLTIDGSDGVTRYQLRMPRAKQRGTEIRGSFKNRYCSKQLGQILESLIAQNGDRYGHLGLPQFDRPMIWSTAPGELSGLQYHVVAQWLSNRIATVIADLTGLKANAKRFRITLGQRSADNGVDKHTLAELLDHSDTQNVHVYYEASPEMALRLDKHLAMDMAPLAQAFAGVVVTTEGDSPKDAGNASKIYDRSLANNVDVPLGDCGQMSFCGLSVPFACYTCRHFKPWIDGPHEAFLEALVADRERMIAEAIDPKIYTIRDRTILAVAEVVQLCEGMREEEWP